MYALCVENKEAHYDYFAETTLGADDGCIEYSFINRIFLSFFEARLRLIFFKFVVRKIN